MKKAFWRWIGVIFVLTLFFALIPTVSAAENEKIEAYQAYSAYLNEEVAGIGSEISDADYYNMLKDEILIGPATLEGLLAVYLVDLTGDGVEELILKRLIEYQYKKYEWDTIHFSGKTEWICIYTYRDGKIERIGQNLPWYRRSDNGGWIMYYPDGFIGAILSLSSVPSYSDQYLRVCFGSDGKAYLADDKVAAAFEGSFTVYSFNGTHMAKDTDFEVVFIPDWSIGNIQSETGSHLRELNGEIVSDSEYVKKVDACTGGGIYTLVNNDYHDVLTILSDKIVGKNVPYGDANPHYHAPTDWITQNNQHYRTCQSGCDVKLDLGECSGGKASCFEKAVCTVCEKPYGEFAEHIQSTKYSCENGKHFFTCKTKGCTVVFDEGDCADSNKDHRCDVCSGDYGIHEAAAGTHICDYCGLRATRCEDYDSNKDHICELCGGEVRIHAAYRDEHICRYCGGTVSECVDKNRDDRCDICKKPFESDDTVGTGVVIVITVAIIAAVGAAVSIVVIKRKRK